MIRQWGLACMDCLVGLRVGRLVEIDNDGLPISPYFQGFRVPKRDHWVGGAELSRAVELFLIGHLGHEVGLVDQDAVLLWFEETDPDDLRFTWVEDPHVELEGVYLSDRTGGSTARLAQRLGVT
jgi:hypothetical protein